MATQLKAPEVEPEIDEGDSGTQVIERDHDADARQHGWVPKDEFKGDPNRWVDAETFNTRADEVMPLLKKQNEHLKRELADVKKSTRRIVDHFEKDRQRLLSELEAKMEKAVEVGDVAGFKSLQKESADLAKEAPTPEYTRAEALEAFDAFRDANPWFDRGNLGSATDTEKDALAYYYRMEEKHMERTKDLAPAAFFALIEGLVKEKYPSILAKAPRQKPPSDVAGATNGRQPGPRGKGFNDLPPEAQRAADKWIKQGLIKDRAAYLASYDWS